MYSLQNNISSEIPIQRPMSKVYVNSRKRRAGGYRRECGLGCGRAVMNVGVDVGMGVGKGVRV